MQIEELIKQRRDRLDLENPPEELWQGIQKGWKRQPGFPVWKYAAILLIGVSTALVFYSLNLQKQVNQLATLSDISEDYRKLEHEYVTQISLLEERLDLHDLTSQSEFDWLLNELRLLDEVNEVFIKDLSTAAPEEQVVKAIIDYYEKKIRILNKIEQEQKRSQHETIDNNDPII